MHGSLAGWCWWCAAHKAVIANCSCLFTNNAFRVGISQQAACAHAWAMCPPTPPAAYSALRERQNMPIRLPHTNHSSCMVVCCTEVDGRGMCQPALLHLIAGNGKGHFAWNVTSGCHWLVHTVRTGPATRGVPSPHASACKGPSLPRNDTAAVNRRLLSTHRCPPPRSPAPPTRRRSSLLAIVARSLPSAPRLLLLTATTSASPS